MQGACLLEKNNNKEYVYLSHPCYWLQVRDLSIAYVLVALTYIPIGVLFYSTFPLPKFCVVDVRMLLSFNCIIVEHTL